MRTVLYPLHLKLKARMTEFAGFEMPVSYSGIIEEHRAVRSAAGLFDLSHMGEFELRGPHALELLERALTNSAVRLAEGQAQYTLACLESGGVIDDLIVYKLRPERYMLCVNAANIEADRDRLLELNSGRAEFRDISEQTALVAIQGPRALEILQSTTAVALAGIKRFRTASGPVAGVQCLIARTGYTGEDGFELFVAAPDAAALFEALLETGRDKGLMPCGLGARDTLRMEAGLALYGHELDRETTPLEAGLSTFVKFGRDFVGSKALAAEQAAGLRKHLLGIRTQDGRSIARQGYQILRDGKAVGVVTSGSFAPTFGRPLAMAYVTVNDIVEGNTVEVVIRGRKVATDVVSLPFYRRGGA
ncbi:MAG TPA: glycine cleavage system aminomethyltransferase GcvT [Candidatus Binataceae bacterium]|jgi:aminomethyltransferase|nr:glycine cleavage system aminomethyltransferase GcvT [Candidatus Binataceae bacterium]